MVTIKATAGICTGRNGTVDIGGIQIGVLGSWKGTDELVRIDCVSKARGIVLNAGFSMDVMCARYLRDNLTEILEKYEKRKPDKKTD